VVAFCKQHKGKRVGNGECTALVAAALQAAGARMHGGVDFNWGKLIYVLERDGENFKATGQIKDVRPGDIVQFFNVELAGAIDDGSSYTLHARQHTAIVARVQDDGTMINIYHQNYNGRKTVMATSLRLGDLQQGRFAIYHPIPRTRSQQQERPPLSDRNVEPSLP
jgi:hypothetical protein